MVLCSLGLVVFSVAAYAYREPIFRRGVDASGLFIRPNYIRPYLKARMDYWQSPAAATTSKVHPALQQHQYVAHGLGELRGRKVPNSKEAFIENYRKGFRLFEIDFIYSIEGLLIASHDRRIIDHGTFMADAPAKEQRLDLSGLKELLAIYPDAVVITDFKQNFFAMLRDFLSSFSTDEEKELLEQIVFQVYSAFDHHIIATASPPMSFLYTNYVSRLKTSELLAFLKSTGQTVAVVPVETITPSFAALFQRENIRMFVHTVNSAQEIEALRDVGVEGFFVDRLEGL